MSNSKKWLVDSSNHGMQSLSAGIEPLLKQLKSIRAQLPKAPKTSKPLLSFKHLNAQNLEDEGLVHINSARYQLKDLPYCGRCFDGFSPADAQRTVRLCEHCELPRRRLKRINDLRLPSDARQAHLGMYEWDSPQQREQIHSMMGWLTYGRAHQPTAPCAYLYGPPGNGKTTLHYALAKEATFNDLRVKWITHTQLLESIQATFNTKKPSPIADAEWLKGIDLLLLDELGGVGGQSQGRQWPVDETIKIIDQIHTQWADGKLAVVLTSNLNPRQIASYFNKNYAVMSRWADMFHAGIEMTGQDRRIARAGSQLHKLYGM